MADAGRVYNYGSAKVSDALSACILETQKWRQEDIPDAKISSRCYLTLIASVDAVAAGSVLCLFIFRRPEQDQREGVRRTEKEVLRMKSRSCLQVQRKGRSGI